MPPLPVVPADLARARRATRAQFAAFGAVSGVWGVHVASVKAHYLLSDGALSLVLLAAGAGALLALLFAGRWVARLGTPRAATAAASAMGLALAVMLVLPARGLLLPAAMAFGAGGSVFDVAINAEGTTLEQRSGRAVMSGLHGMFSVGGMAGAGLAAAMLRAGVPAAWQLVLAGSAMALAAALAARGMLAGPAASAMPAAAATHVAPDAPAASPAADSAAVPPQAHFARPRGPLLLIGLLILAGMTAEGVMYDWSVLYLKDELGLPQAQAAGGYAAFSAAMAAMRFAGDALRARFAERSIVACGAALAALSMALVLASGSTAVALAGYALAGAGLAPAVPILYNAATRVPGVSRAAAIASVSSIGYGGFMLGPPLIGAIAQAWSLTAAMGVVVAAAGVLALGAARVPEKA